MMSTVITTKHNYARNGILYYQYLGQIWQPPEYPEHLHPFLLSLLNKFEISFDIVGMKEPEEGLPHSTSGDSNKTVGDATVAKQGRKFVFVPSLLPEARPSKFQYQRKVFNEFEERELGDSGEKAYEI